MWGEKFASVQTGPGAHKSSCKMLTLYLFPEAKCPGRGVENSPSFSAEFFSMVTFTFTVYAYGPG